jgi:IMP dehydrogenase/GMP reductase
MAEFRSSWLDWEPSVGTSDTFGTSPRGAFLESSSSSEPESPGMVSAVSAIRPSGASGTSVSDVDAWEAMQAGHAVHVRSEFLGETVIWVRDEGVRERVQARHPRTVIYTLAELQELIRACCNPDRLPTIHAAKKILGGIVRPNIPEGGKL